MSIFNPHHKSVAVLRHFRPATRLQLPSFKSSAPLAHVAYLRLTISVCHTWLTWRTYVSVCHTWLTWRTYASVRHMPLTWRTYVSVRHVPLTWCTYVSLSQFVTRGSRGVPTSQFVTCRSRGVPPSPLVTPHCSVTPICAAYFSRKAAAGGSRPELMRPGTRPG